MKRNQYTVIGVTLACIAATSLGKAHAQFPNLTQCDENGNPVSYVTNGVLTEVLLGSWSTNTYPSGTVQAATNLGAVPPFDPVNEILYLDGINFSNVRAGNSIGASDGNHFFIPGSNPPIYFHGTENTHTVVDDRIFYKWTGPLPAPESITFKIIENVGLGVHSLDAINTGDASGISGRAYIDNSLADSDSNSVMNSGLNLTYKHVFPIKCDSRHIYEIHTSATGACTASNSVPSTRGSFRVDINVHEDTSAIPDFRKVTISSIETWRKAKVEDRVGHPVQDEYGNDIVERKVNLPYSDGTGHGDIGIDDSGDGSLLSTDVTYTANRVGAWNIDGDTDHWHHNLLHDTITHDDEDLYDTIESFSPNISPFTVRYNGESDPTVPPDTHSAGEQATIGTDHVHLTYKDGNDGMTATANYYMNVHQGAEPFLSKQTSPESVEQPCTNLEIAPPGYAGSGNGTIACEWNTPGVLWEVGSAILSVMGNYPWETEPLLGSVLALAGVGLDKLKPQADSGGMAFTHEFFVNAPDSAFPLKHQRTNDSAESDYYLVPSLVLKYKPTYELVDQYGPEGFITERPLAPLEYVGISKWVPTFVWALDYKK